MTFSLVNSSPALCDAGQAGHFVSLGGVCDAWLTNWMKLYSSFKIKKTLELQMNTPNYHIAAPWTVILSILCVYLGFSYFFLIDLLIVHFFILLRKWILLKVCWAVSVPSKDGFGRWLSRHVTFVAFVCRLPYHTYMLDFFFFGARISNQ